MEPSPQAVAAVEYALRRLCSWLMHGETLLRIRMSIGLPACLAASASHAVPQWSHCSSSVLHSGALMQHLSMIAKCFSYAVLQTVPCSLWNSSRCAGNPGPKHPDLEAAALGSAALVFFAGRASSPRDLSAAACAELRQACFEVLKDMY